MKRFHKEISFLFVLVGFSLSILAANDIDLGNDSIFLISSYNIHVLKKNTHSHIRHWIKHMISAF